MAVSTEPNGVPPLRMSNVDGAPPQTMGEPGCASWWMVMPDRHSAACCVTAPEQSDRSRRAGERHRDNFCGYAGPCQRHQLPRAEVRPDQWG